MATKSEKHKKENKNVHEEINREEENKIEIERAEKKDKEQLENNDQADLQTEPKEDLSEKVNELEKQVAELKDQLLRKAAEFDNYKRRTENEQLNFLKYAGESLIVKILPVYDDLRRSLEHADSKNSESLIQGIKLVYDKFTKVLKDEGVEKIEAKGKEFDFNLHEALMQREVEGVPPHTVVDEIEPGYIYKDKVVRHAKVIVSQESSNED